jgi:hypothetical protein
MQKKRVLQGKRNLQLSLMNEIQFLYNEGNCSKCSLFWCRKNASLSLKQQLAIAEDATLCFHKKKMHSVRCEYVMEEMRCLLEW